jgi:hypothetical protein
MLLRGLEPRTSGFLREDVSLNYESEDQVSSVTE